MTRVDKFMKLPNHVSEQRVMHCDGFLSLLLMHRVDKDACRESFMQSLEVGAGCINNLKLANKQ